jgi:hypothetical protein
MDTSKTATAPPIVVKGPGQLNTDSRIISLDRNTARPSQLGEGPEDMVAGTLHGDLALISWLRDSGWFYAGRTT